MIRIAISAEAFETIAQTPPFGSVGYRGRGHRGPTLHLAGPGGGGPAGRNARSGRELQRCHPAADGGEVKVAKTLDTVSPSVTEAIMRCDKCKRELSDDEPAWRLWRSLTLCADCKPDTYFREPQPCTRCGRPVHDHATTLGIVYCGTRCQELLLPPT